MEVKNRKTDFEILDERLKRIEELLEQVLDKLSPQTPEAANLVPMLTVLTGNSKGKTFDLSSKDEFRIGRRAEDVESAILDLILDETTVSVEHAVIRRLSQSEFEVEDLGSTNGTRVNGEKVKQRALNSGDEIELGEAKLKFEFQAAMVSEQHTLVYKLKEPTKRESEGV